MPNIYYAHDGGFFCEDCAVGRNGSRSQAPDLDPECPDDHQWIIIGGGELLEKESFDCAHCGKHVGAPVEKKDA